MNIDFTKAIDQLEEMSNSVIEALPNLLVAVIVFIVFMILGRVVRAVVVRVPGLNRRQRNLSLVLGRLAQWGVLLLGFLVSAVIVFPNFSPADVIGLLGVGSVAIGFAFRDIFQNFLAGILLLITEPFQIGDQIVVSGFEGTVEDIETRATTIRTYDNRRVVIPNSALFTDSVTVNTAFEQRRLEYDFGIGFGDDIATAKQLILEAVASIEEILKEPKPEVLVVEIGDFSVVLRVRWWIKPPRRVDALDTRDRVLQAIKETLLNNGIDLPFPTRQILFHDQTEETDGDRHRQREGWPAGKGNIPKPRHVDPDQQYHSDRHSQEKEQ